MTPAINIAEAMLNLMAEEPRKLTDMAHLLDCSAPQIKSRLRSLESNRKVQRQRVDNLQGFFYIWHIAVAGRVLPTISIRDMPVAPEEDEDPNAGQPVRKIVTAWAPNLIRNELETFLFGPARRDAELVGGEH